MRPRRNQARFFDGAQAAGRYCSSSSSGSGSGSTNLTQRGNMTPILVGETELAPSVDLRDRIQRLANIRLDGAQDVLDLEFFFRGECGPALLSLSLSSGVGFGAFSCEHGLARCGCGCGGRGEDCVAVRVGSVQSGLRV